MPMYAAGIDSGNAIQPDVHSKPSQLSVDAINKRYQNNRSEL